MKTEHISRVMLYRWSTISLARMTKRVGELRRLSNSPTFLHVKRSKLLIPKTDFRGPTIAIGRLTNCQRRTP
jgi:hypothetical protein